MSGRCRQSSDCIVKLMEAEGECPVLQGKKSWARTPSPWPFSAEIGARYELSTRQREQLIPDSEAVAGVPSSVVFLEQGGRQMFSGTIIEMDVLLLMRCLFGHLWERAQLCVKASMQSLCMQQLCTVHINAPRRKLRLDLRDLSSLDMQIWPVRCCTAW